MKMNSYKKEFYKYTIIFLFVIGIIFRTYVWLHNISFWCDESALALNIQNRTYLGLLKGLDHLQVCPPFFLMLSKLVIDIFNPQTDWSRDLLLRLIPFISSIVSLPAFYYLLNLLSENIETKFRNTFKLWAFSFMAIMPNAILYSAQFKQYSTEMLVTIILMIIFYKMIFKKEYKWWYGFIIAFIPWLSYSALFIIPSYFLIMIKKILTPRFYIPAVLTFLSCLVLFVINLKSVINVNYSGMIDFWSVGYAFIGFNHPTRFFMRFGETMLTYNKLMSVFAGILMFIPFITYLYKPKDFRLKLFYSLPIVLTLIASAMNKYPIQARLVLFLTPFFCIVWSYACENFERWVKYILILIIFISYLVFRYPIYSYEIDTYGREIAEYLKQNIKKEDVLLYDSATTEYEYYNKNNSILNKSIKLPEVAIDDKDFCVNYVSKLPKGRYYIMVRALSIDKLLELNSIKILKVLKKHDKIKTIYFEV